MALVSFREDSPGCASACASDRRAACTRLAAQRAATGAASRYTSGSTDSLRLAERRSAIQALSTQFTQFILNELI